MGRSRNSHACPARIEASLSGGVAPRSFGSGCAPHRSAPRPSSALWRTNRAVCCCSQRTPRMVHAPVCAHSASIARLLSARTISLDSFRSLALSSLLGQAAFGHLMLCLRLSRPWMPQCEKTHLPAHAVEKTGRISPDGSMSTCRTGHLKLMICCWVITTSSSSSSAPPSAAPLDAAPSRSRRSLRTSGAAAYDRCSAALTRLR
mmetsp:Transcript_63957/g.175630  ORF Transcript_63957/g.175630 Transcript_63957/m.175630 type:complete len:204 (-) Transcript_63957:333-944(-)